MIPIQRRALLATIIGSGAVFLDGSIVNLALPKMALALQAGFAGQQWVVDGYLLTLSALILLGGSLGDMYGRKKVYLWGVAGFGLTSLLCGLAANIEMLVAMRLVQGVFGALMVPGALAIINTNFSPALRGKAIGLWTAATSGVIALGPLLGGYLVDIGSWRWIFFINVPLIALTLWLGLPSIKETKVEAVRRLDAIGALLAVVALGALTYGLIEGPADNWQIWTLTSLAVGTGAAIAFLAYEHRRRDPMLPLGLFRSANFTGANVATFAMYGGLGGFFFILTIYLQTTVHFTSMQAGLSTLPVAVLLMIFSGRVGALSARYGPRLFMTIGPLLAGIGILMMLPLQVGASYLVHILPGLTLFGCGLALTVAPLTTTVLASVEETDSGIASAVNNAISRVAGLIVIALLGIFGAQHAYQFAVVLCGGLAIGAGLLSYILVRNDHHPPEVAA